MNKRYVVGLGEVLWDVLPEGKKLGGAPANFAYHAGQFLGMDNTIAVSALGNDKLADETIDALKEHGLNDLLPRVPYPTGTVQVQLDDQGIPTYDIKENVAWDNIPFDDDIAQIARHCRAVCFGSLAQRNVVSRETMLIGRMFGYPGLDIENKCWLILGKYNLDMLVLTCGTNGSYVFTPGHVSFQETPKVRVADTVGAGDSFTGSFVGSILNGKSVPDAHRIAVQVSAYVCTQNGAMPTYPDELLK